MVIDMKKLLALVIIFISFGSSAQVSVMGGMNMLKSFSPEKPFGGFHLGIEIPRDDAISIYGRYSHNFSQSASFYIPEGAITLEPRDPSSGLPYAFIGATPRMNYHIIEGGTRYYLGNGFDYGFSAYGGTNLMVLFNKVRLDYDPYDEVDYQIYNAQTYVGEGSYFSLGFGLGGGVKYTMAPYGTFYFDLNVNYLILGQPSSNEVNNTIFGYQRLISPLLFNFNLGYRKDFMW